MVNSLWWQAEEYSRACEEAFDAKQLCFRFSGDRDGNNGPGAADEMNTIPASSNIRHEEQLR